MLLIVSSIQIIIQSNALYAENPNNSISNSTISLNASKIEMISPDIVQLRLDIYNPAEDDGSTLFKVEYELFADNNFLGNGTIDFSDIPINGRPDFYKHIMTPLVPTLLLKNATSNTQIQDRLFTDPENIHNIKWELRGVIDIELLSGQHKIQEFSTPIIN